MRAAPEFWLQLLISSALTVTMGFIALFVGLAFRSTKATVVASFLVVLLAQGSVGSFSLAHNPYLPLAGAVAALACAVVSVWRVERRDLL